MTVTLRDHGVFNHSTFGVRRLPTVQHLGARLQHQPAFFGTTTVAMRPERQDLEAEIQTLDTAQAFVKIHTEPAIKVKTLAVPDAHPPKHEVERVLGSYQARYHVSRVHAEVQAAANAPAMPVPFPAQSPYTFFSEEDPIPDLHDERTLTP